MDNLDHIGEGFYVVRTQAGFNKLLKQYDWEGWENNEDLTGSQYPKSYPSVVAICRTGPGNNWVNVKAIPVKLMKTALSCHSPDSSMSSSNS